MTIYYRYAVVSWCPDLTDPSSPSVPLALLMVGTAGGQHFAAAVGACVEGELDPITTRVLSDVPTLVRRHVDDILAQNPPPEPDAVIDSLTDALRGSLHVSHVSTVETLVGTSDDINSQILQKARQLYIEQLHTQQRELEEHAHSGSRQSDDWLGRVHLPPLSPYLLWDLDRLRGHQISRN